MSREWFKDSVAFKLIIIGVLVLVLLIPAGMIKDLIREREYTRQEVVTDISSKWAHQQTVTGPIISIPYTFSYEEKSEIKTIIKYAHFLPSELNITGKILPETRYRGIYQVVVYDTDLKVEGKFGDFDFREWKVPVKDILWDEAFLSIGIPDMRGISNELLVNFNKESYPVDPGIRSNDILYKGVSARVIIDPDAQESAFEFALQLRGSESLHFTPIGKTTKVNLESEWSTPSFTGSFLPKNRQVNEEGFNAEWTVLHLNRSFPQQWVGNIYNLSESEFGVDLLMPVDVYLKSERAVKYAIMFIALTFLVFFFTEVLSKRRFHPIQYLLIGISLLVFYTLLLSFSEHIGFAKAYLLASFSVVSLVGFYVQSSIRDKKLSRVVILVLIALYIFLYTILQLEAYALLMGSVGVFVVLALVMYLSRKINWYAPINTENMEELE